MLCARTNLVALPACFGVAGSTMPPGFLRFALLVIRMQPQNLLEISHETGVSRIEYKE
jgi:hypothetical protein